MIDAMKEVTGLLQQLPNLSIWILAGLLLYKITVLGSIFGICRLLIIKLYDGYTKPKPPQQVLNDYDLSGKFIVHDGTFDDFCKILDKLINKKTRIKTKYIHDNDVDWLLEAIEEKELREMKEKEGK